MMTRQREAKRQAIRKAANNFTNVLVEIPKEFWPLRPPKGITKVYRNNQFIVEVFSNVKNTLTSDDSLWTKVMVRHNSGKPVVQWRHLQDIKNQIFGKEACAIQYLPPESNLINQANMYWFFIKE